MPPPRQPLWQTILATCLALVAFAANSLLCRHALDGRLIDAATFTAVRILSGALVLAVVVLVRPRTAGTARLIGSWASGAALFVYAIAFSLAYRHLSAGVGALLLFGAVQATMIGTGIARGERPRWLEWLGLACALSGLAYLAFRPGATASWQGALSMLLAGIAWGIYSLRGRGTPDPIGATAGNFLAASPMVLAAWLLLVSQFSITPQGVLLAITSGAVTSGLGYVIWYLALPHLTATRAALVQFLVPVLTAALAALLLNEEISVRLAQASAMILGGLALAIAGKQRRS